MREDRKKHRHFVSVVGPSFIRKDVRPDDSCSLFVKKENLGDNDVILHTHATPALDRPDPLGLPDFGVSYSLKKKQRWLLPEAAGEQIENMQMPAWNLRVSAARHRVLPTQRRVHGLSSEHPHLERNPTISYDDVTRDGRVIHNATRSKKGDPIGNLITPEGHPQRTPKERRGKRAVTQSATGSDIEPKEYFQKLHIRYSTLEMMESNGTLTNKLGSTGKVTKSRAPGANFFTVEDFDEDHWNYDEEEVEEEEVPDPRPIARHCLLDCIVFPEEKRKGVNAVTIREETPAPYCISIPSMSSVPSTSTAEAAHPRMKGLTSVMGSVPSVPSSPPLPVSPVTWIVHRRNERKHCAVAKQIANKTLQFNSDVCPECDTGVMKRSFESTPSSFVPLDAPGSGEECPICCEEYGKEDLLPFALACGHFFCTGCWLEHVSASFAAGRLPAPCMSSDCSCTLGVQASRALLDSESLGVYSTAVEEALLASQTLVECPKCKRKIPATRYELSDSTIACNCGASLCGVCSESDHWPLACDAFAQYTTFLNKSGVSVQNSAKSHHSVLNVSSCPNCARLMERSYGCNHMVCLCGTQFCYVCGGIWGDHSNNHCSAPNTQKTILLVDVETPSHRQILPQWGAINRDFLLGVLQYRNAQIPIIDLMKNATLLTPNLLRPLMEWRLAFDRHSIGIRKRLRALEWSEAKAAISDLERARILYEGAVLTSRRNPSASARVINRISWAIGRFLNTSDNGKAGLQRKAGDLRRAVETALHCRSNRYLS